jgi:hypothetical protein
MPRIPTLAVLLAAALPLQAAPAAAQQGVFVAPPPSVTGPARQLTGVRADIARELPYYGYGDVDVRRLSAGQVSQIYHLLYSNRSQGDKRGLIGAVLRRGLLQRGVDRILR